MISTFGWIIICFILLIIKYAFLQPFEDKRLYRLYEARDNVALAAIEGKISQEAEEYKFVIQNINFALHYMKNNYDFSIVLKNLFLRPEEVKEYFSHMYNLVAQYDFLEKNFQISKSYFIKSLNTRLSFLINVIIKPILCLLFIVVVLLKIFKKMSSLGTKFVSAIERRIDIISEISSEYDTYRKMYAK